MFPLEETPKDAPPGAGYPGAMVSSPTPGVSSGSQAWRVESGTREALASVEVDRAGRVWIGGAAGSLLRSEDGAAPPPAQKVSL